MFCINCGKQIPDGAKFCSNCGASQNPIPVAEAPAQEPVKPSTPEINLSETFSDCFGSAQNNVQPAKRKKKSKIKKISKKVKGFLITVLVFLVTFGIRHAVTNGVEGFFGFLGDSIKQSQEKTYDELDALMAELDITVTGYTRSNWAEGDKTGPLIQVIMKNNSGKSITGVTVAIATWDKDGTPLSLTLDDNSLHTSNVTNLTLPCFWLSGTTYGETKGLAISSESVLPQRIQAIPVSWTFSDGEKGSNPYAEDWLYKYQDRANERADLDKVQFPQDVVMPESELLSALLTQPLVTTNYEIAQWAEGDLLCATITNKGNATIKSMYIAYATWDADNKPVIVSDRNGQLKTSNIVKVLMDDLSVAPGQSYGADNGAALHKDSAKVAKFSAIAYRYEDTEGNIWENPYYYAWLNLYEGK